MLWNKLRLNYDKTLFLNFSKRKLNNSLKIYIDEIEIKEASQTKYLGVIFDNRLNWVPHTSNVVKKMAMGCWAIANLKKYVATKTLRTVYFALVYPHIHYGISCWGSASKKQLQKIYVKQKWAVKVITNSAIRDSSTPLFHSLGILKLEDVFQLKVATEIRRLIISKSLHKFRLEFLHRIHTYSTRSASKSNFGIPAVKTNLGKATLKYKGSVIWNNLPDNFRTKSPEQLKHLMKKFILNTYQT